MERRQAIERDRLRRFKEDIENKMQSYFKDPNNKNLKFSPMDHIYRSIIHEVAESLGLLSYSFGTEDIDRYVRVYTKIHMPCEDELAARRRGEPWNDDIKLQLIEKRKLEQLEVEQELKRKPKKFVPNSNYKDKYAHLIGQDAALEAARKTETNKSYGFVPSENKKDCRSIEQTMADIRAKRKLKEKNLDEPSYKEN
ncbi:sperm associated antigen 7 [Holotrichia oblita]|nr:sperm associated antigen 7 [Holotrichia oblita]